MSDDVITLTDAGFDSAVSSNGKLVVDCWAPWCGPCRALGPVIEKLATDYKGQVAFAKLNVDENRVVPSKYGISSIPTILFFKDGQLADQVVGLVPREAIVARLDAL